MTYFRLRHYETAKGKRWRILQGAGGRERTVAKGIRSKREAEKRKRELEDALVDEAVGSATGNPLLAAVVTAYADYLDEKGSPSAADVRGTCAKWIPEALMQTRLHAITGDDIEDLLVDVEKKTSGSTANHLRAHIRAAINRAKRARTFGYQGRNPASGREGGAAKRKHSRKAETILQPEEVRALLEAPWPKGMKVWFQNPAGFNFETAARPGEVFFAKVEHVDLKGAVPTWRVCGAWDRPITKGGDERLVPLSDDAVRWFNAALAWRTTCQKKRDELRAALEEQGKPAEAAEVEDIGDHLFLDYAGNPFPRSTKLVDRLRAGLAASGVAVEGWEHKCRRCKTVQQDEAGTERDCPSCGFTMWPVAQVRKVTWKGLRHARITELAREGVSFPIIRRMAGHFDESLIERHYLQLRPVDLAEMVNRGRERRGKGRKHG